MFDHDLVPLVQPDHQAASDPGPRETASMLAGSNWSNWSNLFIELVKRVLVSPLLNAQPHNHHVLLNCPNIPDQWDHLDQANRHAGSSGPSSYSTRWTTWTNSASQVLSQPSRRRRSMRTPRRARQSACLHQRAHVVHAAHCHAALRLLRSDQPAQHQRFPLLGSYSFQPVAKAGTPSPGSTRLPRGFLKQRSRASSPARRRALRAYGMATSTTAFVLHVPVASISRQGAGAPCQARHASARLRIVLDRYLQHLWHSPAAASRFAPCGLHKAALPSVPGSHCAEASFGTGHRWRALSGEGNRPYAKWPTLESVTQPSALPVRFAPYAPLSVRPCGLLWRCGIGQALRALFQSAASPCITFVPPPTPPVPRRYAALALVRRSARLPPKGAPSVRRVQPPKSVSIF